MSNTLSLLNQLNSMEPKVSELLEKINRGVSKVQSGNFSKLEKDMLMENLRELYDRVSDIEPLKNRVSRIEDYRSVPIEDIIAATPVQSEVPEVQQIVKEEAVQKVQQEIKPHVQEKVEEPVQINQPKTVVVNQATRQQTTINDTKADTDTIHTRISATYVKEVNHNLSRKPLKELIDLNKRFVLVNELFKGNADALASAVNHIDTLPDFPSAAAYIKSELEEPLQWETQHPTREMFHNLVKQRFS